jgi:hypothetical protein
MNESEFAYDIFSQRDKNVKFDLNRFFLDTSIPFLIEFLDPNKFIRVQALNS